MTKAGRNEAKKVSAAYLNGLAVAVLAGTYLQLVSSDDGLLNLSFALSLAGAAAISTMLHLAARQIGRDLED